MDTAVPRGAGEYAAQRYRRGLRAFRRRFYRQILWALVLVVLVELLIALWADSTLGWLGFAFFAGAAFGSVVIARDFAPDHVRHMGQGAWGEQQTAKALAPLEREGWIVRHDIPLERGNIDHLVESPSGRRFLLESKALNGKISVEQGFLTSTQLDDPDQVYRHRRLRHVVLERARRVYAERRSGWVQGVVVIWGDFAQRRLEDGKLVFLHGEELASWLREQAS